MSKLPGGREWWLLGLALAAAGAVVAAVDLAPRVESDFFFATDDPQLAAARRVEELFPSHPQILISAAAPETRGAAYAERVGALSEALAAVPGVAAVRGLTRGPKSPADAFESPWWRRLLVAEGATNILVSLAPGAATEEVVPRVEAVLAAFQGEDFRLAASGVPYVVERIRRHLLRDLTVFSAAAFLLFGILTALLFRSPRVVLGTLACCLAAWALTLGTSHLLGVRVGVLTANLATIVFVLTLSHAVFLTARWRATPTVAAAVRGTFPASFWCMATTLLGFLSLLLASAKPLRELGAAGAVGAGAALAAVYGMQPAFLRAARRSEGGGEESDPLGRALAGRRGTLAVAALAALCLLAALGLGRLNTDPALPSYFPPGSELRRGIETIDRAGGSSPLSMVVADAGGARLDEAAVVERLGALQEELEADPAVGTALSLALLLEEARRAPLAFLLTPRQLVTALEQPAYERVAASFVTADRLRGHILLRMREAGREEPRAAVVARLEEAARRHGFEPRVTAGLYELQGQLGKLVEGSLLTGLGALWILFLILALALSKSWRVTATMGAGLAAIPAATLGTLGHLGIPVDVITSPAANVAVAMGVDSMIHLLLAARRRQRAGASPAAAWAGARAELWRPVLGAAVLIATGFGIFGLSSFPPSRRFGLAVVVGTAVAAAVALLWLPRICGGEGARGHEAADVRRRRPVVP